MGYNGVMMIRIDRINQCSSAYITRMWMLLLFLMVLAVTGCSKKALPGEAGTELEPAIIEKHLLSIGEGSFNDLDFDRFIQFKYSAMSSLSDISDRMMSRIFDSFVEHSLLLTSAKTDGFSISQTETSVYLSDLRINTNQLDETILNDEALIQKYLYAQVYKQIDVDIKECQSYYNKNRQQFKKNKQIMLHQILLKNQNRAFEIKEILESDPSRFEEFALSESESVDSKNNGVMGFFEQGQLPSEIEKYAFALKKNDISQVIQSPYGYHIFRVSQIRAGHNLYFDSVKEEIKNNLLSEKLRQAYILFLSDLKKNKEITIRFENLPFKYVSNDNGGDNDTAQ